MSLTPLVYRVARMSLEKQMPVSVSMVRANFKCCDPAGVVKQIRESAHICTSYSKAGWQVVSINPRQRFSLSQEGTRELIARHKAGESLDTLAQELYSTATAVEKRIANILRNDHNMRDEVKKSQCARHHYRTELLAMVLGRRVTF